MPVHTGTTYNLSLHRHPIFLLQHTFYSTIGIFYASLQLGYEYLPSAIMEEKYREENRIVQTWDNQNSWQPHQHLMFFVRYMPYEISIVFPFRRISQALPGGQRRKRKSCCMTGQSVKFPVPRDEEEQTLKYSGKKKKHTVKKAVIIGCYYKIKNLFVERVFPVRCLAQFQDLRQSNSGRNEFPPVRAGDPEFDLQKAFFCIVVRLFFFDRTRILTECYP
ncbi:MAG: hypothetical protein LBP98_04835 [Tannerella sp.]|jgi:hypothetical protein|nr:hypothetical protein [Tannerella sp.]